MKKNLKILIVAVVLMVSQVNGCVEFSRFQEYTTTDNSVRLGGTLSIRRTPDIVRVLSNDFPDFNAAGESVLLTFKEKKILIETTDKQTHEDLRSLIESFGLVSCLYCVDPIVKEPIYSDLVIKTSAR